MIELIIQLLSGAAGGYAAGNANKSFDMGPMWNAIIGLIGGGAGAQWLGPMIGLAKSGLDPMAILQQVISGGVSGGVLMAIAGIVKGMMANKT